jgi:drug/metabolite transporter (DMT)-like permease
VLSILFGLIAAASWGGGDFFGGLASRRLGAMVAVFLSEAIGLSLLLVVLPFVPEPIPALSTILISLLAGTFGVAGLLLLYRAMTTGLMTIAAPVSAVLGAVVPVIVSALTEGMPGTIRGAGFVLALAGVWLIARGEPNGASGRKNLVALGLPLLSGLCFGLYFIFMHNGAQHSTLWTVLLARLVGTVVLSLLLIVQGQARLWRSGLAAWYLVLPCAVLDVGGNLFYVLASQSGRMDVAVVLSALYPGGTVLLAWLVLKEKINRVQILGIVAALAAIALLTI